MTKKCASCGTPDHPGIECGAVLMTKALPSSERKMSFDEMIMGLKSPYRSMMLSWQFDEIADRLESLQKENTTLKAKLGPLSGMSELEIKDMLHNCRYQLNQVLKEFKKYEKLGVHRLERIYDTIGMIPYLDSLPEQLLCQWDGCGEPAIAPRIGICEKHRKEYQDSVIKKV